MVLLRVTIVFLCILYSFSCVKAADFVITLNDDHNYFWRITRAALDAADGDHALSHHVFQSDIPQTRLLRSLVDNTAPFHVTFTGHQIGREELLHQIDIPLTRGLFGYRVFVIRRTDANKFQNVNTLDDLVHKISLGSGASWPDTAILRSAGFSVKTGSTVTLWSMLEHGRFEAFPRSIYEVGFELKDRNYMAGDAPLMVEQSVMLFYPFDLFFYLAPTDTVRADILTQGLHRIYENGEFMRIFNSEETVTAAMAIAEAHKRKVFKIANPLGSERVQNIPERYWQQFPQRPAPNSQTHPEN
jgi:hypothetical protein